MVDFNYLPTSTGAITGKSDSLIALPALLAHDMATWPSLSNSMLAIQFFSSPMEPTPNLGSPSFRRQLATGTWLQQDVPWPDPFFSGTRTWKSFVLVKKHKIPSFLRVVSTRPFFQKWSQHCVFCTLWLWKHASRHRWLRTRRWRASLLFN